jgi:hypothetical protein
MKTYCSESQITYHIAGVVLPAVVKLQASDVSVIMETASMQRAHVRALLVTA